jgi:hypothetical protein
VPTAPVDPVAPTEGAAPTPVVVAEPMSDQLDLLHGIRTEIAVSSAYRDQSAQLGRLFDGDPSTAWNSRTGELVGAWIEVRIPEGAEVESIGLIPGFARTDGETSLFTGNHRISGVRVLLNGVELDTFEVATETAELVPLTVASGGGVYRIEVTSVLPGTRTDWQETCISELQFTGRAPGAIAGSTEPTAAIGALPPVYVAPPPDRASIEAAHVRDEPWLATAWADFELTVAVEPGVAERAGRAFDGAECESMRDGILTRMARLVEPIDAARAGALRTEAAATIDWTSDYARYGVLTRAADLVVAALDSVATYLDDDAARCRSARAASAVRLSRVATLAGDAIGGGRDADAPDPSYEEIEAIGDEAERLADASEGWAANPRAVGTRLLAMSVPTHVSPASVWPELQTRLTTARDTCAWTP